MLRVDISISTSQYNKTVTTTF